MKPRINLKRFQVSEKDIKETNMSKSTKGQKEKEISFLQGMICAAAMMQGNNTDAEEVLGACGIIDWSDIDEHDIGLLKTGGVNLEKFGYKG